MWPSQKVLLPLEGELSGGLRGCLSGAALRSEPAQRLNRRGGMGPSPCPPPLRGGGNLIKNRFACSCTVTPHFARPSQKILLPLGGGAVRRTEGVIRPMGAPASGTMALVVEEPLPLSPSPKGRGDVTKKLGWVFGVGVGVCPAVESPKFCSPCFLPERDRDVVDSLLSGLWRLCWSERMCLPSHSDRGRSLPYRQPHQATTYRCCMAGFRSVDADAEPLRV